MNGLGYFVSGRWSRNGVHGNRKVLVDTADEHEAVAKASAGLGDSVNAIAIPIAYRVNRHVRATLKHDLETHQSKLSLSSSPQPLVFWDEKTAWPCTGSARGVGKWHDGVIDLTSTWPGSCGYTHSYRAPAAQVSPALFVDQKRTARVLIFRTRLDVPADVKDWRTWCEYEIGRQCMSWINKERKSLDCFSDYCRKLNGTSYVD